MRCYKMVQLPSRIAIKTEKEHAEMLEKLCADMGSKGWDFVRVDSLPGLRPAGCIGGLLGQQPEQDFVAVATFVHTG